MFLFNSFLFLAAAGAAGFVDNAENLVQGAVAFAGGAILLMGAWSLFEGFSEDSAPQKSKGWKMAAGGIGILVMAFTLVPIIFGFIEI